MLSFEELAILLSVESGMKKSELAFQAVKLFESGRFDHRVALFIIDKMLGLDYISKDSRGLLHPTKIGKKAVVETKLSTTELINRLIVA